ncbi:hypothetical protein COOONC_01304 [Cooperia oncophora]
MTKHIKFRFQSQSQDSFDPAAKGASTSRSAENAPKTSSAEGPMSKEKHSRESLERLTKDAKGGKLKKVLTPSTESSGTATGSAELHRRRGGKQSPWYYTLN